MVAGLFYHHGLRFTGEKQKTAYRAFENKVSYPALRNNRMRTYTETVARETSDIIAGWGDALRNNTDPEIMESDDFWKGPIGLFNKWCRHIDPLEHKHIYVRRPAEQVAASLVRHGGGNRSEEDLPALTKNVEIAYEWMTTVKYFCGGVDVFPEKLWNGDYSNIRQAFEYCDLEFDEQIADKFIQFR